MKLILTALSCLVAVLTVSAQHTDMDIRYKKYAGRYGGNDGICLFEDGRYMIYGYATAVFGSYSFDKEEMLFYPDKEDRFSVFATHNKSIGDSTRINFAGFDRRRDVFFRFGTDSIRRVFNKDANCFDGPFVYEPDRKPESFTLISVMDHEGWYNGDKVEAWTFGNTEQYNDFIFSYSPPKLLYEDFTGVMSFAENRYVIKLPDYGGDQGYYKNIPDEDEQRQWKEILDMKAGYDQQRKAVVNSIYANKHYKVFLPDSSNYHFDKSSNQYVSNNAAENEEYFRSNPYKDDRYLLRYSKLKHISKNNKDFHENEVSASSVFFTVCGEGSEHSYRYKSLTDDSSNREDGPIRTIEPVSIPEAEVSGRSKKAYTKDGLNYSEEYENGQLVRREAWDMAKSKSTVQYFKEGKPYKREEITNRYSITEEIIKTYDKNGKLIQRKVASLENNAVIYHVYDGKGKLLKVERL